MIKPIETVYNGYRFRSRLEARWAVFFDTLNISYQYEPEGFDLGDGVKYLPDFYLPEFDMYVEIKPFDKSIVKYSGDDNIWEQKCRLFRDVTNRAILLCYDPPAEGPWKQLFAFDTCDSSGGSSEYYAEFVIFNGQVVLCTEPERPDRIVYTQFGENLNVNDRVGTPSMFAKDYSLLWDRACQIYDAKNDDILTKAKTNARQARFEHGEKPRNLTKYTFDEIEIIDED